MSTKRQRPEEQPRLLDPPPRPWRLDEATCERGRRGVAEARAALRAAVRDHHRSDDGGSQKAA